MTAEDETEHLAVTKAWSYAQRAKDEFSAIAALRWRDVNPTLYRGNEEEQAKEVQWRAAALPHKTDVQLLEALLACEYHQHPIGDAVLLLAKLANAHRLGLYWCLRAPIISYSPERRNVALVATLHTLLQHPVNKPAPLERVVLAVATWGAFIHGSLSGHNNATTALMRTRALLGCALEHLDHSV